MEPNPILLLHALPITLKHLRGLLTTGEKEKGDPGKRASQKKGGVIAFGLCSRSVGRSHQVNIQYTLILGYTYGQPAIVHD